MSQWKDVTSYAQGQRGKIEPNAWEYTVEGVRVWVGSAHRYYPGEWVMHCYDLGIDTKRIGPTSALTAEDAQREALTRAAREARARAFKLNAFAHATSEPRP